MDRYGDYWTYSSHEDQGQAYPYGYNWEQGQHHYEDERFYEDCQGYDDGGYYYDNGMQDQGPLHNQDSSTAQNSELTSLLARIMENQAKAAQEDRMMLQALEQRMDDLIAHSKMLENQLAQHVPETSDNEVEDYSSEEVLESFEDQLLDNTFEMPGQASKGNQDKEDSTTGDCLQGLFSTSSIMDEREEPKELKTNEDLVELDEDLSREPPHQQEFASLEDDVNVWAPKIVIEDFEEWTPNKLGSDYEDPYLLTPPPSNVFSFQPLVASYEDPYLFAPPPNKFWSFHPFIVTSYGWNSCDPSAPKETYYSKGLSDQLGVCRRLDGRRYKWDLKVV